MGYLLLRRMHLCMSSCFLISLWFCLCLTLLLLQVSYGSELSNRAPTFDMDLPDLMDGQQPITYEKAYKFFAQDPSQKWVILSLRLVIDFFFNMFINTNLISGGQHILQEQSLFWCLNWVYVLKIASAYWYDCLLVMSYS